MKDENNVIETKTEKENKMSDTTKEIEKESNAILSKLSEEQFYWLSNDLKFDEFYPTLTTELLTKVKEKFNSERFWKVKIGEFLTEDEFISIVKDYGNVSHSIEVNGEMTYYPTDLSEHLNFDISAEKIEEIGVDEIKKWGEGGYGFERVEENFKSHSIYDDYLEDEVVMNCDNPADNYEIYISGVSVITKVNVSLPNREELFPEKLVA